MDPKPISKLVDGLLRDLGPKRKRSRLQDAVVEAVTATVGEASARRCQVLRLRAGRLFVEVESAPLFAELRSFHGEVIRDGINRRLGRPEVTEIVFRLGGTAHV